jgi:hypothetical protein
MTPGRVFDQRKGVGQVPAGTLEMPTVKIPGECMCSWSVVRAAPGLGAKSALRYRNMLCSVPHERIALAAAS